LTQDREPRNEENLHKPPKGQKSIYEQCMESISKRIIQYEPNMTDFHLVGFGNDRSTPVFNLYSNEDDEISSVNQILSSPYFRDLSSSEDKTQNYIFSVLYPRYYPPLRIHQLSPVSLLLFKPFTPFIDLSSIRIWSIRVQIEYARLC